MFYLPTHLEKKVAELYTQINIYHPEQIDIDEICDKLNILYFEKPIFSHYTVVDEVNVIIVDSRLNEIEKREHFFHELGHIFFHEGLQTSLPKQTSYFQEVEATHFSRYALIPYHMIKHIDFYSDDIVSEVISTFQVSRELTLERISEIKNKMINCKALQKTI